MCHDSSTFYFEFIAVDNNNQSSEISKLIVNKGIVNYSRELKFSNLKCVSRITGAEINGTNGLPIVEFVTQRVKCALSLHFSISSYNWNRGEKLAQ